MEKQPLKSSEIQLDGVKLLSASLDSSQEYLNRPSKEITEVRFGYGTSFQLLELTAGAYYQMVYLDLSLDGLDDVGEPLGCNASYRLAFSYAIPNWQDYLTRNELTEIGEAAKVMLVSISFSTARGILYERSHGTFFSNFMLPIINPMELLSGSEVNLQ